MINDTLAYVSAVEPQCKYTLTMKQPDGSKEDVEVILKLLNDRVMVTSNLSLEDCDKIMKEAVTVENDGQILYTSHAMMFYFGIHDVIRANVAKQPIGLSGLCFNEFEMVRVSDNLIQVNIKI